MPYPTYIYLQGTQNPLTSKEKKVGVPYAYLNGGRPKPGKTIFIEGNEGKITKTGHNNGKYIVIVKLPGEAHRKLKQAFQRLHN